MNSLRILIPLYVFIVYQNLALSQSSEDLLSDFQANAPNAWEKVLASYDAFTEINAIKKSDALSKVDNVKQSEVVNVNVIRKGSQFVVSMEQSGRDISKFNEDQKKKYLATTVSGRCSQYFFTIFDYDRQGQWILQYAGTPDQGKGTVLGLEGAGILLPGLEVPFTCLNPKLGFAESVSAAQFLSDGEVHVSVEFRFLKDSYAVDFGKKRAIEADLTAARKVMVTFNPKMNWLPTTCSIDFDNRSDAGNASASWEYLLSEDVPVAPKQRTKIIDSARMKITDTETFSYQIVAHEDSRFRLPFYGLPEPSLRTSRYRFIWIAGLGAILIGIAIWIKRHRKVKI